MPGRRSPRASASSIIARAIRSLYEPVGLNHSSVTNTSAAPSGTTLRNWTRGVPPVTSVIERPSFISVLPSVLVGHVVGRLVAGEPAPLHHGVEPGVGERVLVPAP